MINSKTSPLPTFVSRTVKVAAVVGVLLGASISFLNKNDFISAVIIMGVMGLVFSWLSRWLAVTFLRAWLETKIEQYKKQMAEEDKLRAEKAAAKQSAKAEAAKKESKESKELLKKK